MFFSLIVLSKSDSDRTLPVTVCFTLTATLATEQVAIVSSSKALRVLSVASCVKTTGPDTKDTRGQEAQEAGGESDVPFLPPSVNKRKNP